MVSGLFKQDSGQDDRDSKDDARAARTRPDDDSEEAAYRRGLRPGRDVRPGGASVVASGTEITGEVTTRGDLRIEGKVDGDVRTRGEVVVSTRGTVEGDVEADVVVVEGRIDGTVAAREVARFRPGCHVSADIRSPAVQLDEGAIFNGRIEMEAAAGSVPGERKTGAGTKSGPATTSEGAAKPEGAAKFEGTAKPEGAPKPEGTPKSEAEQKSEAERKTEKQGKQPAGS